MGTPPVLAARGVGSLRMQLPQALAQPDPCGLLQIQVERFSTNASGSTAFEQLPAAELGVISATPVARQSTVQSCLRSLAQPRQPLGVVCGEAFNLSQCRVQRNVTTVVVLPVRLARLFLRRPDWVQHDLLQDLAGVHLMSDNRLNIACCRASGGQRQRCQCK